MENLENYILAGVFVLAVIVLLYFEFWKDRLSGTSHISLKMNFKYLLRYNSYLNRCSPTPA